MSSLPTDHRGVIFPTYGLAEHTVYVCSNGRDRLMIDRIMFETEWKVCGRVLVNGGFTVVLGDDLV